MSRCFLLAIYYISFAPLWLSVLIINGKSLFWGGSEDIKIEVVGSIFIIFLMCISWCYVWIQLKQKEMEQDNLHEYEVKSICEQKNTTVEFMLSYVLPLFAFDFTRWDGMLLFLIFFVVFGYLTVKHRIFSVNIILEIMRYHIYDCAVEVLNIHESADSKEGKRINLLILSKRDIVDIYGTIISVSSINNDIKLDMGKNE